MNNRLRHLVFWPAFGLLTFALVASLVDPQQFLKTVTLLKDLLLKYFGTSFSVVSLLMVLACLLLWISPIGKRKIGGENAVPLLNKWRWFSITLCTTIATGILFWGTAEPIYHLMGPPESSGIVANSPEAAEFAMSTMYLHWSFTPYAIYAIPTIAFALAFYNRKAPFSLASMLFPFNKGYSSNPIQPAPVLSNIVDAICLFALVAGMAASLGAGILTLSGGLNDLFGIPKTNAALFFICLVTVLAFIISASTGLMKGIRMLSSINMYGFIAIALILFFSGPMLEVLALSATGLKNYFLSFFEKNLYNLVHPEDSWANGWTVFYWANWMAWAPITAMFLGRISRGYTVRQVLLFNWVIPSLFSMIWMSIFSGTALHFQLSGKADLNNELSTNGAESIIYSIMSNFSLAAILPVIFIVLVFLSYVTAADSNTEAMGGISIKGIKAETASPPIFIKIIWGICIGATAYIMISLAGIEGIKMLSNLGGFPALLLLSAVLIGVFWLIFRSWQGEKL